MARLLILTDCPPDDFAWTGAMSWKIILAMAESHHEVVVATTSDLADIPISHPRLNIIRPINSWRASELPKLLKVLFTYRPQVIHTFALKPSRLWPSLSVWPYFTSACALIPGLQRFAMVFDLGASGDPSRAWLQGSARVTVFSEEHRAELHSALKKAIDVLPLDLDVASAAAPGNNQTLIPAAVSEWENPQLGLKHLCEYLLRHPQTFTKIVGGWGDLAAADRKEGWRILEPVLARVELCEPMNLPSLIAELRSVNELWLEPLRRDSWRFLLSAFLAERMDKRLFVTTPVTKALMSGSTANSLSRLYRS